MANRIYNKQVATERDAPGWNTKGMNTYPGSGKNGVNAYDCSGTPQDKRGAKGAKNGADKTGYRGATFADKFKRK